MFFFVLKNIENTQNFFGSHFLCFEKYGEHQNMVFFVFSKTVFRTISIVETKQAMFLKTILENSF